MDRKKRQSGEADIELRKWCIGALPTPCIDLVPDFFRYIKYGDRKAYSKVAKRVRATLQQQ